MRTFLLILTGLTLCAEAQLETELAPRELERGEGSGLPFELRKERAPVAVDQSAILIDQLVTIELRGDVDGAAGFSTDSGSIRGSGISMEPEALFEVLATFIGSPLTEDGLDRVIDTVLRHYERNKRPVTDVFAPAQDLGGGILRLEVLEGRIGEVGFETKGAFNDRLLSGAVRLEHGQLLDSRDLQAHLDWYNRNPFRPAALYAAPGLDEGEADLVFAFEERRPWRVYTGYENSGAEAAGEGRFLAGVNWGNAFGQDQLLSYQFTMGETYDGLNAHSASWEIPIHPWHHFLRFSGTHANIQGTAVSQGTTASSSGASWLLAVAYGKQLPRWNDFRHEVSFGAEVKSSDNFLIFGALDAHPGTTVEIVQFRADYQATRKMESGVLDLKATLVASPGGLLGSNDDADFALFRAGAESEYAYLRTKATWVRRLPKRWTLRLSGEAQVASGELLPTEQLALGGHATVRGYEERDYLADHGYAVSSEVRAPAWEIPTGALPDGSLQILGFLDHGTGWRDGSAAGEESVESFTGAGVGLRAQIGPNFSLRADLAVPLDEGGAVRGHLGATLSY